VSGFARTLQRRWARTAGSYDAPETPYRLLPDGGYAALHPTKGWRRVSGQRRRAQGRMARLNLGLTQRNRLKADAFNVLPRAA
jgi:hypothetical protein